MATKRIFDREQEGAKLEQSKGTLRKRADNQSKLGLEKNQVS